MTKGLNGLFDSCRRIMKHTAANSRPAAADMDFSKNHTVMQNLCVCVQLVAISTGFRSTH